MKSPLLVERLGSGRPSPAASADRARRWARSRLGRAISDPRRRAIARAVVLGERRAIAPELARKLRDAGVIHVVAVSGLHVGTLLVLVLLPLRWARASAVVRFVVLFVCGLFFVLLVGPRPPVLRAACAAIWLLCARSVGREGEPINSLAVLASLLVAASPMSLADPGLQLSFLATGGIFTAVRSLAVPDRRPGYLRLSAAVSLGAYVATAPVAAWWFGRLAPIGLVINLAVAALCGGLLLSGIGTVAAFDLPLLGPLCAAVFDALAALFLAMVDRAANVGDGHQLACRPGWILLLAYYGSAGWWSTLDRGASNGSKRLSVLLLSGSVLALHLGPPPRSASGPLDVTLLDVGQAQAVVVTGSGSAGLLIDAAGRFGDRFDPGEQIVLPALRWIGSTRLDALVISHGDVDHAGGAFAILRDVEVGEIWLPVGYQRDERLRALADLARSGGTALVLAERGHRSSRHGPEIELLGPPRSRSSATTNERSIVLRIGEAPCRLLVPGDLGESGEAELLASGLDPRAEALIVGHHGSRGSSGVPFLESVSPATAAISCGAGNRFGHPHPVVLRRLREIRATIWRTDLDGMVHMRCTGEGWRTTGLLRSVFHRERRRNESEEKYRQE